MCVVFSHVVNNTQCLRRVGRECWILWSWTYRWLWGAGTWAVVRAVCALYCWATLWPFIYCFFFYLPSSIFFFMSMLKRTLFAPQAAIWWNQCLKFYLKVDDYCFLWRTGLKCLCTHCVLGQRTFMSTYGIQKGKLAREVRLLLGQRLLDWFCFWFPLPLGGSELTEGRKVCTDSRLAD